MLFPITFSIPKEKICIINIQKTKILSNLIPGKTSTYIYNTEKEYYNEYQESYFAITTKKAGWDCLRHYEILANRCVPLFINIDECPINTLFLFPKKLLFEAINLYNNKFANKKINELTTEDINEYAILQNKFLEYTKNYLTTDKIAKYILQKTNHENINKILYLSQDVGPDYLRCLTLHGFKSIFGSDCHDYPKIPHIYKSQNINYANLYGKGMTYTNLLEQYVHDSSLDTNVVNNIKNKYYDIVIYGSYHRGMPYYDLICSIYKPNEIILLCGEDLHNCNYDYFLNKQHFIFIREM
uniref:Uncharacterized protein n=1 Tax=viral metagenome TaxID=1070528 RepID=A0A6C0E0X1_9ZZZZ